MIIITKSDDDNEKEEEEANRTPKRKGFFIKNQCTSKAQRQNSPLLIYMYSYTQSFTFKDELLASSRILAG